LKELKQHPAGCYTSDTKRYQQETNSG